MGAAIQEKQKGRLTHCKDPLLAAKREGHSIATDDFVANDRDLQADLLVQILCIYMSMYACIHIYMYMCICIYIYIYESMYIFVESMHVFTGVVEHHACVGVYVRQML